MTDSSITSLAPGSLHAVIDAAVTATAAASGWVLRLDGDGFVVAAAAGGESPGRRIGERRALQGTAGYAASSGQPAAIRPQRSDPSNFGAGGAGHTPSSILAVPCEHEQGAVGVLELVDAGSGSFSFDDVEVATLLANVASACLSESAPEQVPTPDALAVSLTALASAAPDRYRAVARTIDALLS